MPRTPRWNLCTFDSCGVIVTVITCQFLVSYAAIWVSSGRSPRLYTGPIYTHSDSDRLLGPQGEAIAIVRSTCHFRRAADGGFGVSRYGIYRWLGGLGGWGAIIRGYGIAV